MIQEYAVDPNLFSTLENYRKWSNIFRAELGRVISEYPKNDWIRKAYDAVNQAGLRDNERKSLIEKLKNMRTNRMLAKFKRENYDQSKAWFDNAEAEHRRCPFQAVVTSGTLTNLPGVLSPGDVDCECAPFQVDRECRCERSAFAIATKLGSLLAAAREVKVIDPYFRPDHERFTNSIHELLKRAIGGAELNRFEIHCKAAEPPEIPKVDFEQSCKSKLSRVVPSGARIHVFRWKERSPDGPELHDRFVLTQLAGVNLGAGTAERDSGHVRISLISEAERARLWAEYKENATAFSIESGPTEVRG